jgi:hypothetical protein
MKAAWVIVVSVALVGLMWNQARDAIDDFGTRERIVDLELQVLELQARIAAHREMVGEHEAVLRLLIMGQNQIADHMTGMVGMMEVLADDHVSYMRKNDARWVQLIEIEKAKLRRDRDIRYCLGPIEYQEEAR